MKMEVIRFLTTGIIVYCLMQTSNIIFIVVGSIALTVRICIEND